MILLLTLLSGCSYKVNLVSEPVGALIRVDGDVVGVTPYELVLPLRPLFFDGYTLEASMPGYRTLELDFSRDVRGYSILWRTLSHPLVAVGVAPLFSRELMLVEERGPIGTW
jgi:hypothetical protein